MLSDTDHTVVLQINIQIAKAMIIAKITVRQAPGHLRFWVVSSTRLAEHIYQLRATIIFTLKLLNQFVDHPRAFIDLGSPNDSVELMIDEEVGARNGKKSDHKRAHNNDAK